MNNNTRKKIVWTPEERSSVARRAAEISWDNPSFRPTECLDQAQSTLLPTERQRRREYLTRLPDLWQLAQEYIRERRQGIAHGDNSSLIDMKVLPTTPSATPPGLIDALLSLLRPVIQKLMVEEILPPLRELLATRGTDAPSSPAPVQPESPRLLETCTPPPWALVVGIKRDQLVHVEKDFSGRLRLTGWHVDESADKLRNLVANANRIIIMTSWIGHKHQNCLRKALRPETTVVRCNGGLTDLRRALEGFVQP